MSNLSRRIPTMMGVAAGLVGCNEGEELLYSGPSGVDLYTQLCEKQVACDPSGESVAECLAEYIAYEDETPSACVRLYTSYLNCLLSTGSCQSYEGYAYLESEACSASHAEYVICAATDGAGVDPLVAAVCARAAACSQAGDDPYSAAYCEAELTDGYADLVDDPICGPLVEAFLRCWNSSGTCEVDTYDGETYGYLSQAACDREYDAMYDGCDFGGGDEYYDY